MTENQNEYEAVQEDCASPGTEKMNTEAFDAEAKIDENKDFDAEAADTGSAFASLDIYPEILRAVEGLGFSEMTPIQQQAIPVLLTGRDVIGQAQTGTGKTAAFGIPILQKVDPDNKNLQALILCPTRELAMQAADDLRDFAKYMQGVKVLPVYGGQDILRQIQGLKGVQVVVGTPGRVMDHMRRHTIKLDDVSMVVLDEADEMLDMGFREDMELILGEVTGEHQTCLFSATMPEEILKLTDHFQKNPILIKITQKELTVDSIKQYSYGVKYEYKTQALMRLLSYYRYKRCIIFCNTKARVDELADTLTKAGYAAEGLHGDLTQKQRDSVMGRFRSGHLNILIATDIAARGIDVDDVEAVINYDIPMEAEYYVHRIGRTGRAGKEGVSHSLCRSRDFRKIHEIEGIIHVKMEERKIPTVEEIKGSQEQEMLDKVMACLNDGHSGSLIPMIRRYCEENGVSVDAFAAAAIKMQMVDTPDDVEVDLPERRESDRPRRRGRFGSREEFREARRNGFGGREEFRDAIKPLFAETTAFIEAVESDSRNGKKTRRDEKYKELYDNEKGSTRDDKRKKCGNERLESGRSDERRHEVRESGRSDERRHGRPESGRSDERRHGRPESGRSDERRHGRLESGRTDERRSDKHSGRKSNQFFDKKSDKAKRKERSLREMNKAIKDVRMNGKAYDKKRKRK